MSFVRKKKYAESEEGVARQRKIKSAGSHTDLFLMADHSADACSDTICFGLLSSTRNKEPAFRCRVGIQTKAAYEEACRSEYANKPGVCMSESSLSQKQDMHGCVNGHAA